LNLISILFPYFFQKNKTVQFGAESVKSEQAARKAWLETDRSIVRIQKLVRGHFGRQRVRQVADRLKRDKEIQAAWVEVRDQETGDVWFFNEVTGESQWEMPQALEDLMPRKERLKKLPALVSEAPQASDVLDSTMKLSQNQNASGGSFPSMKSSSGARPNSSKGSSPRTTPRNTSLPSINRQPGGLMTIELCSCLFSSPLELTCVSPHFTQIMIIN
jgi:hypothetical protein